MLNIDYNLYIRTFKIKYIIEILSLKNQSDYLQSISIYFYSFFTIHQEKRNSRKKIVNVFSLIVKGLIVKLFDSRIVGESSLLRGNLGVGVKHWGAWGYVEVLSYTCVVETHLEIEVVETVSKIEMLIVETAYFFDLFYINKTKKLTQNLF